MKYHNRRVLVSKEFTFDAAHNLINYKGKCENLHGHTYKLIVGFSGYTDERDMVLDFGDVKKLWQDNLEHIFDHAYLNDSLVELSGFNTTAENMVVYLYDRFAKILRQKHIDVEFIKLYETPTSYAEARKEWMEQ